MTEHATPTTPLAAVSTICGRNQIKATITEQPPVPPPPPMVTIEMDLDSARLLRVLLQYALIDALDGHCSTRADSISAAP